MNARLSRPRGLPARSLTLRAQQGHDVFKVQEMHLKRRSVDGLSHRPDLLARHQGPNLKFTPARTTFSVNGTVNGTAGPQFTEQDTLPRLM